jgi:hypothetical protein
MTFGSVAQSVAEQHCSVPEMGHVQALPGVLHLPPLVQSPSVQQAASEMQDMLPMHSFSPEGHWHTPPGMGHTSPVMEHPRGGGSELVQQVPVGMQVPEAGHPT